MSRVPTGWHRVSLDKIAYIQTGIAKGGNSVNDPVYLPYLRVANVQDGYLDLSEIKEIEVDRSRVERYLLREGDVILTEGGDFDKLGRGTVWRSEIPICLHQNHVFAVRVNQNEIMPEFFAMQAASPYGKQYFLSIAKRTTNLASINKTQLSEFPVLLPPLAEQRKIAEILSTWDEAIQLVEALIAALKTRKRGLMQRLLTGEVRFPGFNDEWEEVNISDVAELIAGGTPSTANPAYWDGDVRWMRSGDIHKRRIHEVEGRISEAGLNNSNAQLLPLNSVLVALAGQGKTRGTVAINKVELSTNQSVAAIIPDASEVYFEYLFDNLEYRYEELRQLSTGAGGRGGLNLAILKSIKLPKPPLNEQVQIADVLKVCDQQLELLQVYIADLQEQKKGLMQRLLTGEVRVRVE